jgi:hypothetical protein
VVCGLGVEDADVLDRLLAPAGVADAADQLGAELVVDRGRDLVAL